MIVAAEKRMLSSLKDIQSLVQQDLKAQDELIQTALHSPVALIRQISHYIIHSGGKRIRPLLAILTAHALGIESEAHLKIAVIVEFIHTATLLHDDVVDHSSLRRGQMTAHALFGAEAAVLTGDFLYSRAFQLMATLHQLEIMSILAEATNTIAEGEVLQLQNIKKWDLSEADYRAVIASKTATLFAAACELSAVIVHKPEYQKSLREFGMHLGLAFQMMDDLLDYTAKEAELGKHLGDDIAEGKMTLPLIYALQQAPKEEVELILGFLNQGERTLSHLETIVQFIARYRGFEYTDQSIQEETERAYTALSCLPPNVYTEALHQLLVLLTKRRA